jgi:hypothetical protein
MPLKDSFRQTNNQFSQKGVHWQSSTSNSQPSIMYDSQHELREMNERSQVYCRHRMNHYQNQNYYQKKYDRDQFYNESLHHRTRGALDRY